MRIFLALGFVAALFMAAVQLPALLASAQLSGGLAGFAQRVAFYDFLTFLVIAIFCGAGAAVLDELRSIRLALTRTVDLNVGEK